MTDRRPTTIRLRPEDAALVMRDERVELYITRAPDEAEAPRHCMILLGLAVMLERPEFREGVILAAESFAGETRTKH